MRYLDLLIERYEGGHITYGVFKDALTKYREDLLTLFDEVDLRLQVIILEEKMGDYL